MLLAWVNASRLAKLVTDRTGLQNTGELIVGVPKGDRVHLVLPPSLADNVQDIALTGAIKLACDLLNGTMIERDYRGQKVIVAYTPVGYQNWGIYLNHPLLYHDCISLDLGLKFNFIQVLIFFARRAILVFKLLSPHFWLWFRVESCRRADVDSGINTVSRLQIDNHCSISSGMPTPSHTSHQVTLCRQWYIIS